MMTSDAKLPVLINREGGAASKAGQGLADTVSQAFRDAGGSVDVRMLAAKEMEAAIEAAAKGNARIVVAGGDGTIAAAAQQLAGTSTELGILPLGTLNHFALDLGIPTDLVKAAELALHGKASPVDVGEVNGRRFINNASVGLYPFMVRNRDDIRERRGWSKWPAMLAASFGALSRLPHHRLRLDLGRGERQVTTPLLLIGNNRYSLEGGKVGRRDTLSDGKLSVYAVARTSRLALLWFAARALVGRADRKQDFEELGETGVLRVASPEASLEVGLDGEIVRLTVPLEFALHAGALHVIAPPREAKA